jgi:hypothetical protein
MHTTHALSHKANGVSTAQHQRQFHFCVHTCVCVLACYNQNAMRTHADTHMQAQTHTHTHTHTHANIHTRTHNKDKSKHTPHGTVCACALTYDCTDHHSKCVMNFHAGTLKLKMECKGTLDLFLKVSFFVLLGYCESEKFWGEKFRHAPPQKKKKKIIMLCGRHSFQCFLPVQL